ncbi:MAG: glyoxalase, partial [Mucilaginibacter sp.]|nr:glyoxalase [Mucilaginibacter sp.]
MESLSPNIFVNSMDETIVFYKSIGFQLVMTVPEAGSDLVWAMMVNGNVTFMFQIFASLGDELPEISRQNGASQLLYIKLKKIRDFFELI